MFTVNKKKDQKDVIDVVLLSPYSCDSVANFKNVIVCCKEFIKNATPQNQILSFYLILH